jgi:ribosomal protein S14
MLSAKIQDLKIRKAFSKIEKIKKIKKFLFVHLLNPTTNISLIKRNFLLISLLKKPIKYNVKTRIRMTNRCVLNNRSRGVLRPYGISRILMRDLMQFGILPGYTKAVW